MFSWFRNPVKQHNGFLFIALSVTTTGLLLSLIIFFVIKPYLIEQSSDKSVLFIQYINYIVPLIACILYFNILDHYYKVLFNAVIGVFLKELLQRILILICVMLYFFKLINFNEFVIFCITCRLHYFIADADTAVQFAAAVGLYDEGFDEDDGQHEPVWDHIGIYRCDFHKY
jgi:Na+-transporting NADH:ubiquinone oxidoreductase subunit NqrE